VVVRAADGSFVGCWRLEAVALAALCVLWTHRAHAQRVERDCPRLSEASWQELEARLRVLLGVHARPELALELRCDETSAAVVLSERGSATRLALAPNDEIVEGTLAVVEAELVRRQTPASEPNVTPQQAPPAVVNEPSDARGGRDAVPPQASARAEAPVAVESRPRERSAAGLSGGIGLGIAAETWDERPAFGPRLHLALGHEQLCAVAVESLGFGHLERHAALTFSTELGAAWGAPYASGRHFGAQVLLGHEWLSASENDAAPSQTSGVWSVAFGGRAALPLESVSLFVGPDLRLRLGDNELGPPLSVGLPAYSVLVQAGAFWIQQAMPARR
jgi:hypothetical protein